MANRTQIPAPRDGKPMNPMTTSPDDDEAQEGDFTRVADARDDDEAVSLSAEQDEAEDEDEVEVDEGEDEDEGDEVDVDADQDEDTEAGGPAR